MPYREDKPVTLIAITAENRLAGEAAAINRLFAEGLRTLHLRKPLWSAAEQEALLQEIDAAYHPRVVLHDHFELTRKFNLKGVHLNRRSGTKPENSGLSVSKSCHTLSELTSAADYDYLFLSPIFSSISKQGYESGFTEEELLAARADGLIHPGIYALGGVTEHNIPRLSRFGFGGAVVLGALWQDFEKTGNEEELLTRFHALQRACGHTND